MANALSTADAADETTSANDRGAPDYEPVRPEPHAAIRWARAVVPLVDSPTDPRTIDAWGKAIHASASALRNWCFTAGIGPRRSLVFGRLLRAVALSEQGRYKPDILLDSVDRRTLVHILTGAGFSLADFPRDLEQFLDRQVLVRDPDALRQVKLNLSQRRLL
jgi:hypothetical protein